MTFKRLACLLATVLALGAAATPAAAKDGGGHSMSHRTAKPDKPRSAGSGRACRGERGAGRTGTPYSRCVKAMGKAQAGEAPKKACKGLSKKHVKGEKGTAYSRCVVAAARLRDRADAQAAPAPDEPSLDDTVSDDEDASGAFDDGEDALAGDDLADDADDVLVDDGDAAQDDPALD